MAPEKKLTFLLLFVFIFSRIPFINSSDVFFDSGEYLHLFSLNNFKLALFSGHFPLHIGYVIFGWPIYHLSKLININPGSAVILAQIFLTAGAIYSLFNFLSYLTNKKIALFSVVFLSLTPLFWISNSTIMMENAYFSLFCFSLYFLTNFLKKNKKINLHLSIIFLTLAILTHLLLILWVPFYLSIVYLKNKKKLIHTSLVLISYLVIFSLIEISMISTTIKMAPSQVAAYLYLSKQQEFVLANPSMHNLFVSLRNLVVLLFTNFSGLLISTGVISQIYLIKKKSKLAISTLLWILPAYITSQWWDSLLPGRHGLIAAIGFSFLTAFLIKDRLKLVFILVVYLLIISVPALAFLKQPIPYITEANFVARLPKDSLLIETHFAKPQVEKTFKGKVLAVNQSGSENPVLDRSIKKYLSDGKQVFISSGALSEPYDLYSGPYIHALTFSYFHDFQLKNLIVNYALKPYKTISHRDNLYLYHIISQTPSQYPKITQLKNSERRIDYFDPISRLLTYLLYK